MKAFRIVYKDSSVQVVTGESMNKINEPVKWGFVGSIEEIKDYEVSLTPILNSPFKLVRMASGKLYLHEEGVSTTVDLSQDNLMNTVENHITHLECHIDGLNRELENLKQKIYELVRDQPKSSRLQVLRELCGYIENGTDTTVTIFQDDATKSWHVRVGDLNTHTGASIALAIQNAYDKHPKQSNSLREVDPVKHIQSNHAKGYTV